ncbi:MAG: HDOD domain-containing protein [Burkholderiaceae bacterium]|nr:HDOD domain-containing protein [Burkholderiaceae bacterium]
MLDTNFIVREPLLDPKQTVLGYELSLQGGGGKRPGDTDFVDLAGFIAEHWNREETGWLFGEQLIFLDASPALVLSGALAGLPAKNLVLAVPASDLSNADMLEAFSALRSLGCGILLRDADLQGEHKNLLPLASHIELLCEVPNFGDQVKSTLAVKPGTTRVVARRALSWEAFDACAAQGLDSLIGNVYMTSRPGSHPKGLNPAQTMILQLMDMVRKNADVRKLEEVLKRDAGLSYKLLRYINSAGFGLGAEIQSLRHAVTMLGYSPLYRWLSVLLATASTAGYSPVLMHTAIVRGRFAELLGKGFIPKSEVENLFVAGMFSLLDRLLGVPMADLLENVQLSEPVTQALLAREGMYGPFLALAEACEFGNNEQIGELADSLFISPVQVNEAHLAALAWAQSLKI